MLTGSFFVCQTRCGRRSGSNNDCSSRSSVQHRLRDQCPRRCPRSFEIRVSSRRLPVQQDGRIHGNCSRGPSHTSHEALVPRAKSVGSYSLPGGFSVLGLADFCSQKGEFGTCTIRAIVGVLAAHFARRYDPRLLSRPRPDGDDARCNHRKSGESEIDAFGSMNNGATPDSSLWLASGST